MNAGARSLALKIIGQVKGQRQPIEAVCRQSPEFARLDPRDQALTRGLVTHTFRHHHALDAAFALHLSRPIASLSPAALGPLRLGLVELLVMKTNPHAALNEAVKLAPKSLKGLVNAVLRKVSMDQDVGESFLGGPCPARLDGGKMGSRFWPRNSLKNTGGFAPPARS